MVAAVIAVFQWDAEKRISLFQDMMESQGRAVADIVAESSIHGLNTFNSWENEVDRRLVNNALWLVWLDSHGGLDKARLHEFAETMGLYRIVIFNRDGAREASSQVPPGQGEPLRLPPDFLQPLLDGTTPYQAFGFKEAARTGDQRVLAGAARLGGGAIVVNIKADELLANRSELGPGHLIKSLGEARIFRYIVIQNRTGIQAASTTDLDFPLDLDAPFLTPLEQGKAWVSREFSSPKGSVFEVSRKLTLGADPMWLRVGLDATLLDDMRADTRKHAFMRLALLLAGLLLVMMLTVAWQKQGALDQQVARITAELAHHEAEARRREKLVAMGSLAAGVAHQIRNPLNGIHMIAQVLERKPELTEPVREEVRHIRHESARIEEIVKQFLTFARPREPIIETLDLARIVREVVDLEATALATPKLTISAYAPGLTAAVDRQFVIEILENLIRNAAQALHGQGKILVSLIGSGEWAEIVVEDNGPGIAPDDRERIFDLYYTTRAEGMGLGLSLTAQMATAMGGQLRLDDEAGLDGRGARFVVRLPVRSTTKKEDKV